MIQQTIKAGAQIAALFLLPIHKAMLEIYCLSKKMSVLIISFRSYIVLGLLMCTFHLYYSDNKNMYINKKQSKKYIHSQYRLRIESYKICLL